jgi:hypothetical protein
MTALAPIAALVLTAAPLRVAYLPLVGGPDVRSLDEVIQRELADIPGVALISPERAEPAFGPCAGQMACIARAAQALHLDELVLGLAALDRDSWLIELSAIDPNGAVVRSVSARWRADASQLKTLAGDLLNRLLAPDRNLSWMELESEGGTLEGLTLSLDGQVLPNPRPGEAHLLTEGPHRLSIVSSRQEIELLFQGAPRDHLRVWAAIDQGTARVVPATAAGGLGEEAPAPVPPSPSKARTYGGFAALGASALLAGGGGWAGVGWSRAYSNESALTRTGALSDPGAAGQYQTYNTRAGLNEGLSIGLGSAAIVAAGLGLWLLVAQ